MLGFSQRNKHIRLPIPLSGHRNSTHFFWQTSKQRIRANSHFGRLDLTCCRPKCFTPSKKCATLNPWAGLVRRHSPATGLSGVEPESSLYDRSALPLSDKPFVPFSPAVGTTPPLAGETARRAGHRRRRTASRMPARRSARDSLYPAASFGHTGSAAGRSGHAA